MAPGTRAARARSPRFSCSTGLILGSWAARIPAIKERLDLGEAELGLALGLVAVGALVAMPVSGWMSARGGSRRTTRFAFVGCCLALPLPALAPELRAAAAGRIAARRGQRLARRRDERARRRRRAPHESPILVLLPRRLLVRRADRRGLERARRRRRPRRPLAPARRGGRGAGRGARRLAARCYPPTRTTRARTPGRCWRGRRGRCGRSGRSGSARSSSRARPRTGAPSTSASRSTPPPASQRWRSRRSRRR